VNGDELLLLAADLFAAIHAIAGYSIPERMPQVHVVPQAQLQAMVCQGACQVKAFYLPEKGVFVNEQLNFAEDVVARSVLLHELVHHVQHVSGKFEGVPDKCDRWYSKELQAYEIQNAYLRQNKNSTRFVTDSLPGMCVDRGE
jgi:hypothetical protein